MFEFKKPGADAVEEVNEAELRDVEGGQTTLGDVIEANKTAGDGNIFHAVYYMMFVK
jgi:hypothetical protein